MSAATVVNGVLLAVILATWIWTWDWNRRVIHQQTEPDYNAAMAALTTELIKWRTQSTHLEPGHVLLERPTAIMLYATRKAVARKVVDAALNDAVFGTGERT